MASFEEVSTRILRYGVEEYDCFVSDLEVVLDLLLSKEIRDFEGYSHTLHELYAKEIARHFLYSQQQRESLAAIDTDGQGVFFLWALAIELPEVNTSKLSSILETRWVSDAFKRISGQVPCAKSLQRFYLKWVHWLYSLNVSARPYIRSSLGSSLSLVAACFTPDSDTTGMLNMLSQIILGHSEQSSIPASVAEQLIDDVLLPLHRQNGMLSWRDQQPILKVYNNELVCAEINLVQNVESSSDTLPFICLGILRSWPEKFETNTPREVLLLHGLEKLLEYCNELQFQKIFDPLMGRLQMSLQHDNFAPLEKALQMFKNTNFVSLLKTKADEVIPTLVPVLFRNGHMHWNPTVNKWIAIVLRILQDIDSSCFAEAASMLVDSSCRQKLGNEPTAHAQLCSTESMSDTQYLPLSLPRRPPLPPSCGRPSQGITSVPTTNSLVSINWKAGMPPPVTITGVAPWAQMPSRFPTTFQGAPSSSSSSSSSGSSSGRTSVESGLDILLSYIARCTPVARTEGVNWQQQQAAASVTLLPNLKFHDLVFGRELGAGAFSTVRYARVVTPGYTQSQWPEYAVKCISVAKIEELNYTESAQREIAILRLLGHPGIARMVSSFRYTGSVYMVLEYGSAGDLHTHVMDNGPMNPLCCRFVIGEILAALHSIHEIGFVFNDLKPENVLITEIGHVKLTDFGACRPYNSDGESSLSQSRQSLHDMRSGHWRGETKDASDEFVISSTERFLDNRVEGTPAYMPLEALNSSESIFCREDFMVSLAIDTWALGCVTSFCTVGRPPFYGDREQVVRQIKSRFGLCDSNAGGRVTFDSKEDDETYDDDDLARLHDFISSLLVINPRERCTIERAAQHPFFSHSDVNPFQLHSQPAVQLNRGGKRPNQSRDGDWGRRQFSHIWYDNF